MARINFEVAREISLTEMSAGGNLSGLSPWDGLT
jgi:hypothetical protein